jgi:hypothetical protein
MDKSVVGLLGGVSALALIGCPQSALAKPVLTLRPAQSYAELLDPITNAAELLREVRRPGFVEAQFYYPDGQPYYHHHHHHHHHHHSFYQGFIPRPDFHHHHHHHHHQFVVPLPGY